MSNRIPKIIHQTWKTSEIPKHWSKSRQSWEDLHPTWEYILWTDNDNRNLILDHFPHLIQKYDSYPYNIQRVDFVRPIILYMYGGIYCDLDIVPVKPFDDVIDSDLKILMTDGKFTNMLMASSRANPFWLEVIEEMQAPSIPWYAGTRHFYIQATTGPLLIDRVATRMNIGNENVFRSDLFQPCTRCDNKPCKTNDSYVELLEGGSWNSWDSMIIDFACCRWDLIIILTLVIVAMIIHLRM